MIHPTKNIIREIQSTKIIHVSRSREIGRKIYRHLVLGPISWGVLATIESAWRPEWSSSANTSYTIRCRFTRLCPSNLGDTIFRLKWVSPALLFSLILMAACPACWCDTSSISNPLASNAVCSFVLIRLARLSCCKTLPPPLEPISSISFFHSLPLTI